MSLSLNPPLIWQWVPGGLACSSVHLQELSSLSVLWSVAAAPDIKVPPTSLKFGGHLTRSWCRELQTVDWDRKKKERCADFGHKSSLISSKTHLFQGVKLHWIYWQNFKDVSPQEVLEICNCLGDITSRNITFAILDVVLLSAVWKMSRKSTTKWRGGVFGWQQQHFLSFYVVSALLYHVYSQVL